MSDLHPEPVATYPTDHRETDNRAQLQDPSHLHGIWKRAVEGLAADLQIEPIEAHWLLYEASDEITKGLAWKWWLP